MLYIKKIELNFKEALEEVLKFFSGIELKKNKKNKNRVPVLKGVNGSIRLLTVPT